MKKISNYILIVIFAIAFYFINSGLLTTDDQIYRVAFNSMPTLINWLKEFYTLWSGRLTLTMLINVFANLPIIFFKIANVISFIILILASYKIISILINNVNEKIKNAILITIFCSIFFISIPVINSGAIWLAGAMNYLWPVSAMLVAIIPFISELKGVELKKRYYVFAILANLLAGFSEQTSAILLAFGLITLIWCKIEKKKINKALIAHYITIIICSLVNLLAPGNSARSYAEEIKWYPSYSSLSLMDKLVQGYIHTADHLINNTTILFSIIAILSSYFIITDKKTKKANKIIATLPIIYVLTRIVLSITKQETIFQAIFGFQNFNINTIYSRRELIQLMSSSFIILLVAGQLIYAFKSKRTGIIVSILYCASLCSALALAFSPTIFASGNRIFISTDILLVLISVSLWTQLFQKLRKKEKNIWNIILLIIIIVTATFFYIEIYRTGIGTIIY